MQGNRWIRLLSVVLVAAVLAGGALSQSGCLTPAEQKRLAAYSAALETDAATFLDLKTEAEKYRAELAALLQAVKDGKVPAPEALALAAKLTANWSATMARVEQVKASIAATQQSVDDLRQNESPWWIYLVGALPAIAAVGAAFVPALSPVAAALAAARGQLAVRTEIAGSLSRTLDSVAPDPADKELHMLREQSRDELAVKADYDEIRQLAQAGKI